MVSGNAKKRGTVVRGDECVRGVNKVRPRSHYQQPKMIWLRQVLSIVVAAILCSTAWYLIGTSLFMKPGPISYFRADDGRIMASWRREILWSMTLDLSSECESSKTKYERHYKASPYYQKTDEVVTYEVPEAIVRCFDDGVPVLMRHEWRVPFIVPLRPVTQSYVVENPPETKRSMK